MKEPEIIYRDCRGSEIKREFDSERKRAVIEGYASTIDADMDDLVFDPEKIDFSHYDRNPVLLFNHNRDHLIGTVFDRKVDSRGVYIRAEIDIADPFAATKFGQVERNHLRTFSIGVIPLEEPRIRDGKVYFGRVQMREISLVTVGANTGAQAAVGVRAEAEPALIERAAKLLDDRAEQAIERIRHATSLSAAAIYEAAKRASRAVPDEREEIASALAEIARLIEPTQPPENGGGSPPGPPPPTPPVPANPYAPPEPGGAVPAPGTAGPGGKRITGSLVPKVTAPDIIDGHIHRIMELLDTGRGQTSLAGGPGFLPHAHSISNWVVIPVNVAGRVSDHPGSLYPGHQMQAGEPMVREVDGMMVAVNVTDPDPELVRLIQQAPEAIGSTDIITRPFPNEHSCRIEEPGQFVRCRRDNAKDPNVIVCFRKDGSSELQALRYPKDKWDADRARKHCQEHGGRFEKASGEEN